MLRPADRDLSACTGRDVEDLLETGHVGGERRDDNALVALEDELLERLADDLLARGVAGRSTLVESLISASRPFLPSSPMRTRSIISPETGVRSILKSPVCRMVPSGVVMASATESAIEWLVWMNSILKQPSLIVSPGADHG